MIAALLPAAEAVAAGLIGTFGEAGTAAVIGTASVPVAYGVIKGIGQTGILLGEALSGRRIEDSYANEVNIPMFKREDDYMNWLEDKYAPVSEPSDSSSQILMDDFGNLYDDVIVPYVVPEVKRFAQQGWSDWKHPKRVRAVVPVSGLRSRAIARHKLSLMNYGRKKVYSRKLRRSGRARISRGVRSVKYAGFPEKLTTRIISNHFGTIQTGIAANTQGAGPYCQGRLNVTGVHDIAGNITNYFTYGNYSPHATHADGTFEPQHWSTYQAMYKKYWVKKCTVNVTFSKAIGYTNAQTTPVTCFIGRDQDGSSTTSHIDIMNNPKFRVGTLGNDDLSKPVHLSTTYVARKVTPLGDALTSLCTVDPAEKFYLLWGFTSNHPTTTTAVVVMVRWSLTYEIEFFDRQEQPAGSA